MNSMEKRVNRHKYILFFIWLGHTLDYCMDPSVSTLRGGDFSPQIGYNIHSNSRNHARIDVDRNPSTDLC